MNLYIYIYTYLYIYSFFLLLSDHISPLNCGLILNLEWLTCFGHIVQSLHNVVSFLSLHLITKLVMACSYIS